MPGAASLPLIFRPVNPDIICAMPDLFSKWKQGLTRTRNVTFGKIASALGASELNQSTWDELESTLLQSDVGVEDSLEIVEALEKGSRSTKASPISSICEAELREQLIKRLDSPNLPDMQPNPFVIMVVGVNGSGKTTTIAKLAKIPVGRVRRRSCWSRLTPFELRQSTSFRSGLIA